MNEAKFYTTTTYNTVKSWIKDQGSRIKDYLESHNKQDQSEIRKLHKHILINHRSKQHNLENRYQKLTIIVTPSISFNYINIYNFYSSNQSFIPKKWRLIVHQQIHAGQLKSLHQHSKQLGNRQLIIKNRSILKLISFYLCC